MIKLSKLRPQDNELLVFDVRHGTPKVFLGRIIPLDNGRFKWESAWGFSRGEQHSLEEARECIAFCAKGMYK